MNYNSTKEYGKLVKELALLIASPDSIYDKASSLYEFNEVHFVLSRLAYRELYNNYKYPSKDEIITFVLDEYVLTDIVKTVFLTKLFRNDKVEIEFIKREIGDAYSFICHVQELLQIMSKTAHPDINDSTDSIGINDLIQKVIADSENKQKFSYAYNCMAAKEALQEITVQHTQSASQDNAKLKESYTSASKDIGTPEGKYDFCHEMYIRDIYKYLQDTRVISKSTSFNAFVLLIKTGNASIIKPLKKWKFYTALSYVEKDIKAHEKEWKLDITESLGIKSNELPKNKTGQIGWYETLDEFMEKHLK